jgi:hypothetical protein
MKQLDRVSKIKDIKKGQYYVERHILSNNNEPITKRNQKTMVFILGECPGCGTQLIGDIDLSQDTKEMPCFNKECAYKFIYKDNTLFST